MKWHLLDQSTVSRASMSVCVLVLWPFLALMMAAVSGGSMGPDLEGLGPLAAPDSSSNGDMLGLRLTSSQLAASATDHQLFNVTDNLHRRSKSSGHRKGKKSAVITSDRASSSPWTVVATASNLQSDKINVGQKKVSRRPKLKSNMQLLLSPQEAIRTEDQTTNGEPVKVRPRRQCPSCQPPPVLASETERRLADTARLESIKRQILIKLGLHAKPNVSAVPSRDFILETLLRAEESLDIESRPVNNGHTDGYSDSDIETTTTDGSVEDDFFGKTSEIIAFAEQGPHFNGQVLVEFSRSHETEPSLRVKSATLWIYVQLKGSPKHIRRQSHDKKPTLYVFRVAPQRHSQVHNTTLLEENWNELIVSQRVTIHHSGWKKINVTEGIQKWFSESGRTGNGREKLRLLIDCSGCGAWVEPVLFSSSSPPLRSSLKTKRRRRRVGSRSRSVRQSGPEPSDSSYHRPFLVVHTDSTSSRRLRRRALDCSPTTRACCKQRFFVSFRALGWDDWIIAPSGYYANYCRGDCGGPHRTPDTFLNYHTHVLEEFRRMDSFPDLQPCCAPTKFSSMSLIYFGPDMNIIKRDLPKMVVDECGCP